MRRSAIVLGLLWCAAARAQTVDATVMTLMHAYSDPRDGNVYTSVPLTQQVALTLSDVKLRFVDDLKVVVSGWGQVDFLVTDNLLRGTGDLDLGFIQGKLFDRRLTVTAGRMMVYGGGARMQPIDGGRLTLRIVRKVYLDAYGGVPVTYRFATRQGDATAGARLYWRPTFDTELGASFAELLDKGLQARQDLGVDARWRPIKWMTLSGYALMSLLEVRLAEADLGATLQPISSLQIRADYRRTSPDLFLPRSSILSVFSQETRDEAGADVYWRALSRLRLEGDWHALLEPAGFGQRGGARVSASLGPAFETTLAAEVRVLRLATNDGYTQARIYAIQRLTPKLVATLDLDAYLLEKSINGQTFSFASAATLGWDFAPRWRFVVSGIADSTPLMQRQFEGLAKLVFNGTYRLKQVQK